MGCGRDERGLVWVMKLGAAGPAHDEVMMLIVRSARQQGRPAQNQTKCPWEMVKETNERSGVSVPGESVSRASSSSQWAKGRSTINLGKFSRGGRLEWWGHENVRQFF